MAEIEEESPLTCSRCGKELAGDGTCLSCTFRRRVWMIFAAGVLVPLLGVGACFSPMVPGMVDMRLAITAALCLIGPLAALAMVISWGHR